MTTTDPTITIAGLLATIEREYYREQACTMAGEIVELQAERRGHAAERQSLTAERDALAAQLAEARAALAAAPKVCAIHIYEHGPGPCMTCGAWPPGTRELIAACRTRIAGLEQAANAELAAIRDLVAPGNPQETVVDAVRARLDAVENAQAFGIRERDAAIARAEKAESDLSDLTAARDRLLAREHEDSRLHAQLRAELAELRARPVLTVEAFTEAYIKTKHGGKAWPGEEADRRGLTAQFRATFAALGPVTLPAQDRAEELVSAWRGICTDSATCDLDPAERMRRALASLGAPPTSPPAARPVFAGVSEDELIRLFYVVGTDGIDHGEQCPPIDISDRNGIRAVLARLEVSLVAPVDPEKFARNAYNNAYDSRRGPLAWDGVLTAEGRKALADEARHALTAAGVPVTPERK